MICDVHRSQVNFSLLTCSITHFLCLNHISVLVSLSVIFNILFSSLFCGCLHGLCMIGVCPCFRVPYWVLGPGAVSIPVDVVFNVVCLSGVDILVCRSPSSHFSSTYSFSDPEFHIFGYISCGGSVH